MRCGLVQTAGSPRRHIGPAWVSYYEVKNPMQANSCASRSNSIRDCTIAHLFSNYSRPPIWIRFLHQLSAKQLPTCFGGPNVSKFEQTMVSRCLNEASLA